ncbi:MAG: hypothetical protein KGI42_03310 [Xanthomonadaceae bacterium]|nr:hypothetical protein [Xanthomonadaceae bacterium]
MYTDKKGFTRRGFPVSELDIERAKIAAHAAGQSLNVWVQRAIRSALDAPPAAVSDSSAPAVADLAAEVAELRALRQEWQRQMSSVGTRLALLPLAPPPSPTTPPPVDESGLAPLALS